jgi:hypothetical protein
VADLDCFNVPKDERAAILLDLSEAGLVAYKEGGDVRHRADVEEALFARDHPRESRRNPAHAASVEGRRTPTEHRRR